MDNSTISTMNVLSVSIVYTILFLIGFMYSYTTRGLIRLKLTAITGRIIKDLHALIKETLKASLKCFLVLSLPAIYGVFVSYESNYGYIYLGLSASITGYLTLHFINVWRVYSFGILIDSTNDRIDIPASDVENSLIELLTFRIFFDHGKRESLILSEVERLDNFTDRNKGRQYFVTLSGLFGSRQLAFSSKQKRDEFRTSIYAEYRKATRKPLNGDFNMDY